MDPVLISIITSALGEGLWDVGERLLATAVKDPALRQQQRLKPPLEGANAPVVHLRGRLLRPRRWSPGTQCPTGAISIAIFR
jgi:hypothetical protein